MLKNLGLAALSASVVAVTFIACGPDGTGTDLSCVTDADCTGTEICHPEALVCVETCNSGADCPDHAKTCGAVTATDDRTVCQCATDQLCETGPLGAGAVCQEAFSACTPACEADVDCPTGFACETTSGQCRADGGGNGGACTPACDVHETCDTTGATPTCVAVACSSTAAQPDACAYGAFCSGSTCERVPEPTCANFTASSHAATFDPATSDGPITYSMTRHSYQAASAFCGGTLNRFKVKVEAYDPAGGFPAATCNDPGEQAGSEEAALAAMFHRVTPDGMEINMGAGSTQCVNTTNGGKNVTFYVNYCSTETSSYTAGLHFVDGNEFCATISAQ